MGAMDRQKLWSWALLLLPGVLGDFFVEYPSPICAIEGSTVIIPCSYRYPNQHVPVKVIWCINHPICQDTRTPRIYESDSKTNKPGLNYLGDLSNNCALQIENIQMSDSNTYRFRFETQLAEKWTGQSGVEITVKGKDLLREVNLSVSCSDITAIKEGADVTLTCTAPIKSCTFNQLELIWYRDNHTLEASGPSLHLTSVSQADSGNYSCGFESIRNALSKPYRLHVEAEEKQLTVLIVVAVLSVVLVITVAVAIIFLRRRKAEHANKENRDVASTPVEPDNVVYCNIGQTNPPARPRERRQHTQPQSAEEDSYASIDFTHSCPSRPVDQLQQKEEGTIYSLVSRPVDQLQQKEEGTIYSLVSSRCQ